MLSLLFSIMKYDTRVIFFFSHCRSISDVLSSLIFDYLLVAHRIFFFFIERNRIPITKFFHFLSICLHCIGTQDGLLGLSLPWLIVLFSLSGLFIATNCYWIGRSCRRSKRKAALYPLNGTELTVFKYVSY